ncbi:MAG: urease accessory protein UreD, partial [Candidatus Korobacteraceae bacterium]
MEQASTKSLAGSSAISSLNPDTASPEAVPKRVGRDGFLRLRFERRGEETVLSHCRFALPLQAQRAVRCPDGTAYLMMLNPTGGVLGGDSLVTEVTQGKDTHVCLTTPSATRIYRTAEHPAVQSTAIRLAEGSTLEYFPDHVIPHAGSALTQSLRVDMATGSKAILCEAMACGRLAAGERWQFREFDSLTEVSFGKTPIYINRTRIVPSRVDHGRWGIMENFHYM